MLNYFKNILLSKKPFYHYSMDFEVRFLNKLNSKYAIKDDFTRSYCQYKCFRKIDNPLKHWLVYCIALITNPFYIFFLFLKGLFVLKTKELRKNSALDLTPLNGKFLNKNLKKEFDIIKPSKKSKLLTFRDCVFLLKLIFRFPFAFYFHQKIINGIAHASYQLRKNKFSAVITSSEFWFDSSILTYYYESHNIEHINVMHGEKLLWFRDSFFRFHRTYVWEDHYINVLTQMYAEQKQFIIAPSFELEKLKSHKRKSSEPGNYTYYLQGNEPIDSLKTYREILIGFNKNFVLRPHPRYTRNQIELNKETFNIENPNLVSIIDSIKNSEAIISQYSTVLYQGYLMGKNIILDDLTNPVLHDKLQERKFILCSKKHQLLSSIIKL